MSKGFIRRRHNKSRAARARASKSPLQLDHHKQTRSSHAAATLKAFIVQLHFLVMDEFIPSQVKINIDFGCTCLFHCFASNLVAETSPGVIAPLGFS